MKRNKMWVLLIVAVLSVSLLSGCSQAENNFIDLMNESSSMKVFESQETASLKLNKLPSDLTEDNTVAAAAIQSMLSRYAIKSNVKMDANKQVSEGKIVLVDTNSGAEKEFLSYVASEGTIYVKVDDLVALANTIDNQELKKSLSVLEGVQYVSISSEEMAQMFPASGKTVYNIMDIQKQQSLYQKLVNTLSKKAFDGYETGMVKEIGKDKFTLNVDKQGVLDNIKPLMVYYINNADKINTSMVGFLEGLDDEELAMLSLTPEIRSEAVSGLSKMTDEVVANPDKYLDQVDELAAAAKEGSGIMGDKTGIKIVMEKLGEENFAQTTDFAFNMADPENAGNVIDMEINSKTEVKGIDPFTVSIPETNIISFTDLQKKMPRTLNIDTGKKQYTVSQGFSSSSGNIDLRIEKGYTYLPVRTIGEALNETVGWDSHAKQAYVVKDGKNINMAGAIYNSRAFIKIRDFEKLGYTVTWNNETKTATITQ